MASPSPVPSASQPARADAESGCWEGRLFGAFRLLAPDGADATPTSRKARALVAYLLSATDDVTTRERLAGLLWSERGEDQARASLRQAVYELRALTSGDSPLIAIDRTRVLFVTTRVTTDGARLEAAAQAADAIALAAVVGDRPAEFLADLDGIDPVFDEWLSFERTRRRDGRRRALLVVADRKLAAEDDEAAQQLADRLLACDPADEAAARIAMRASHHRGDRDAVRRHFASVTEALRRLVGVSPSAETEQVYQRSMATPRSIAEPLPVASILENTSDDLNATVDAVGSTPQPVAETAEVVEAPTAVMPLPTSHGARRWTLVAAAIALLAVGAVEIIGWRTAGPSTMQRVLLVEPMHVAGGDADAALLQTGFTAELSRVVVGKPAFIVRDADEAAGHSMDTLSDQTFVVTAESQSHNGVLRVGLRLLARKNGPILWASTLVGSVADVDALREQMAVKIADVAVCALDGRHTNLRDFRPDTLQLLFRACDLRHGESLETAKVLEKLTEQVPRFGHGWALLAVETSGEDDPLTTAASRAPARSESYARRALEMDPHDGTAYLGRAYALQGIAYWPQRMSILRQGLAVDPDNAGLELATALDLAQLGYLEQALAWSERAVRDDPYSPLTAALHARLLGDGVGGISGPAAATAFSEARQRFGPDPELALAEFRYQALCGNDRRAMELLADPTQGNHFQPVRAALWAALIETRADPSPARKVEAERAFDAAIQAIPDINPWTLETLSFLHRVDEAYAYADRMPAQPPWVTSRDALFNNVTRPLRDDPRFMTLAARLGLVTIWRTTNQWPDFCKEPGLGYDCRQEADRALSANPRPLVAPS